MKVIMRGFSGLRDRFNSVPNFIKIGLLGLSILYISVAGVISMSWPWWPNVGDSLYNIDYVYVVSQGEIPDWTDRVTQPQLADLAYNSEDSMFKGDRPHTASSHPPLFYAIQSVFMGGFLESGEWKKAIAVGRAVTIALGVVLIFLLAWCAWLYSPKQYREQMTVAVPAVGIMLNDILLLNRNFANDILTSIFATAIFIIVYYMITVGVRYKLIFIYSVVVGLGMMSRSTFIVIAFSSLAVIVGKLLSRKGTDFKKLLIVLASAALSVVIFSGWFYMRNIENTGNFSRAGSQDWISISRDYKSLYDVLTSSSFYGIFYAKFTASLPQISGLMAGLSIGGLIMYIQSKCRNVTLLAGVISFIKEHRFTIALFTISFVGVVSTQIVHSVGYGGFYFRYMLPVVFVIAYLVAFGMLQYRIARGLFVMVWVVVLGYTGLRAGLRGVDVSSLGLIGGLVEGVVSNGVPPALLIALLIAAAVGLLMLSVSLFKLTGRRSSP